MHLTSSAFSESSSIPRCTTCDGENLSPPPRWDGVPAGTRSFVLLCDDPDARGGTWHRWAACDIPATRTALASGMQRTDAHGLKEAINDFQHVGYGGSCPPHRHGPHRYHFRLLAHSVDRLALRKLLSCREDEQQAQHALAEATLVGVYRR